MGKMISDESGINATRELGKYLGMPVLQRRINKDTFGDVLEKVSSRLAGWKGKLLSFAGRITLTKAVLSSIPVHTMSTALLPQSTLNRLDKTSRSFIWGDTADQRRQHLLSWDRVCVPKSEGGLGIRRAQEMNIALIAKLGWRLLNDAASLWARVLRSKYKVKDVKDAAWFKKGGNYSSTWRGVLRGMRDVVIPGMSWVIGSGHTTSFWRDKWLLGEPLLAVRTTEVPETMVEARVCDLWQSGLGWKWHLIEPHVSGDTKLRLAALVVDEISGARDRFSWGYTQDGEFSVKSAYDFLTADGRPRQNSHGMFMRAWQATVPERIRVFLWLVMNQAIMTNAERARSHLCDTSLCQVCKCGEKSIIHILRDCPAMEGIWRRIVPIRKRREFFEAPLLSWLYNNLGGELVLSDYKWSTLFAIAVWWGWKWRCENVFDSNRKCRDRVKFVKDMAKEIAKAHARDHSGCRGQRIEREIRWEYPIQDWWKVNTDGASRGNPGLATAGDVLRDANGAWVGGFALNIGICSAPLAELWGVYYGLNLAWERRVPRLILEVDSEVVVKILHAGINDAHPLSFLARLCYGFFSSDWIVRIKNTYREANQVADGLANYAFSLPLGFHLFTSATSEISGLLLEDVNGSSQIRFVNA
ncbi:unnamed protein product [Microthlaspi erraticum]|uniref:RNase H type-1 domain-containing protein n=1 Tax=Microthlaspi erraticum TaxID=1685480 RepID=A0A6D2IRF3_9BRAS|nr:unnamed protein product [Microthlaspi erraticum]